MRIRSTLSLSLLLLTSACAWPVKRLSQSPNALWAITHGMCVPNVARTGSPSPCAEVDTAAGFVVIKDIRGRSQHLLIPTARVSGIESPMLLRPGASNYFFDAWAKRDYVIATLGKPLSDDELSLAINPTTARSQDQLHIHIDCIRPDARRGLAADDARITGQWSDWAWHGRTYRVRRLAADQLRDTDLFQLVAAQIPDAAADMGTQTIFVTGAANRDAVAPYVTGADAQKPGSAAATIPDPHAKDLYIVVWRVRRASGDGQGAERLQDHACTVADAPAAPPGALARP
ncbi:CDP-diacylglycerol diphosphatase [Robbsia sp. Bb-Pol-6]|uniref:CDP-diacylglycerol pyrophosphatase n=1 Tax=Robbsia betulipollinis TaxID=2981849 RepID=A0ABT3ZLC9_9BURK|nr:CDP-diacylglycerol diphosphatase [Robbsia betulipollinis]MCY0387316.1 CDP-diacylglycerol diphosphatase [Robbsia betulipollinis]